jgi:predicted DNA-binding transcriptional regulator AlpA
MFMPFDPARRGLKPLLTIADLERLLRVTRRTIARLCRRGDLPVPIKIGGSNRWKAEDIERVLARRDDNASQTSRRGGGPASLAE